MSTDNVEEMVDEQALRHLLDDSDDFDFRRRIRARLRQLKKDSPPATETEKPQSQDFQFVRAQRTTVAEQQGSLKTTEPKATHNGHKEFLEKSSVLRNVQRDGATARPFSTPCGMQLEPVALRSSPRPSGDSKKLDSSGVKLEAVALRSSPRPSGDFRKSDSSGTKAEAVVLRKVTQNQKPVKDDCLKSRSNAAKSTPKDAFSRFKEMDLNSDAGRKLFLETGERGARRRSPSPNSIRDQMLEWCRARVCCYDDIQIDDFSSSWNDGMAFCALVHSFYPEAFDYDSLDRKDKRHNFQLAFDTAENLADVVPLLDVEDMIRTSNPDWKCVFTYVNCFAQRMSEIRKERKNAELLKEQEKQQKESD